MHKACQKIKEQNCEQSEIFASLLPGLVAMLRLKPGDPESPGTGKLPRQSRVRISSFGYACSKGL